MKKNEKNKKNDSRQDESKEDKSEVEPLGGGGRTTGNDKEIKELLKKNLELSSEILERADYIKRYVFWQRVWGFLKLLIIVVPIVLAIIYLPPFLKGIYDNYKNFIEENLNIRLPDDLDIRSMSEGISGSGLDLENIKGFSDMSQEEKSRLIDEYNNMTEEEKRQALQELNKK